MYLYVKKISIWFFNHGTVQIHKFKITDCFFFYLKNQLICCIFIYNLHSNKVNISYCLVKNVLCSYETIAWEKQELQNMFALIVSCLFTLSTFFLSKWDNFSSKMSRKLALCECAVSHKKCPEISKFRAFTIFQQKTTQT
jgi:hypothetical protein